MTFDTKAAAYFDGDLTSRTMPPFAGRAAAAAATILPNAATIEVLSGSIPEAGVVTLRYRRIADDATIYAMTTNGGAWKWVPDGDIWEAHFGANLVPGTTDMAPALQAAIDYAHSTRTVTGPDRQPPARVNITNSSIYLGSRISWPSAYQGVQLIGHGSYVTTDIDTALFRAGDDAIFDDADAAGTGEHYSMEITGCVFRNLNPIAVGSKCIELGRAWWARIHGCQFWDFDVHIDGLATGRLQIFNNTFYTRARLTVDTTAFVRLRGIYRSDADGSLGTGCRIYANEFDGLPADRDRTLNAILIHSADAVYYENNHMRFVKTHVHVMTLGSLDNYANNKAFDIISGGNNYFDGSGSGPNLLVDGFVAYDDVPSNPDRSKGHVSRIRTATKDKFRGASTASHGIMLDLTETSAVLGDYVANRGLPDADITGEFGQHVANHVNITGGGAKLNWQTTTHDMRVWQSNTGGTLTESGSIIRAVGGRHDINGVTITGEERNAPQFLISYNGAGGAGKDWGISVANVDARVSTYTGASPFNFVNMTGVGFSVSGVTDKGDFSQASARRYSAQVTGEGPVVGLTFTMPAPSTASAIRSIRHTTVCDSVTGSDARYARIVEDILARRTGGTTTVAVRANVANNRSAGWTNNQYPASLVPLFGTGWVTATPVTAGEVQTNGGNVYLAVKAGTTGATGPVSTSGLEVDGTVTWVYAGPVTANTFVAVLSGETGHDLRFAGEVEMLGV